MRRILESIHGFPPATKLAPEPPCMRKTPVVYRYKNGSEAAVPHVTRSTYMGHMGM
jgi:hypothetical protein